MWRKTESHILHGYRYFSQAHLYCRITYSQFLMLNFETDLHFCLQSMASTPGRPSQTYKRCKTNEEFTCLALPFQDLYLQVPTAQYF